MDGFGCDKVVGVGNPDAYAFDEKSGSDSGRTLISSTMFRRAGRYLSLSGVYWCSITCLTVHLCSLIFNKMYSIFSKPKSVNAV